MAYHSDYYDTEEYDDRASDTNCDECGERYEDCTCPLAHIPERYDNDEGQPEGLFDDYLKSGDDKDLPF